MTPICIRARLSYGDFRGPTFHRFLPIERAAVWIPLGATRFETQLFVDVETQRQSLSLEDIENIDKFTNPSVGGLTIKLRASIEDALGEALAKPWADRDALASTHDFADEVLNALRRVHGIVIGFFRHDRMQHWMTAGENHHYLDVTDQRLAWYDARWQRPADGLWQSLHPACPRCPHHSTIVMRTTAVVGREEWSRLEASLKAGRHRAPPHRRLLAGAFSQFDRRELRSAIVEAVSAWELALSTVIPDRMAETHASRDRDRWEAILRRAGLRSGTELAFALLPELSKADGDELMLLIQRRNDVVHMGAVRLDDKEVEGWLWSLRKVMALCEGGPPF